MSGRQTRHDKPYRRGLILGLTIAEVMILLIFLLLMALSAALANRDHRLAIVDKAGGSRLAEAVQQAYPNVKTPDDYFKELTQSIDARKRLEGAGSPGEARHELVEDAKIGRATRTAAKAAGIDQPAEFIARATTKMAHGKKGEWPPFFSLSEAGGYYFDSGKATLRPEFEAKLAKTILPLLRNYIDDYDVDVVEVIGHTDEVPMVGTSNLDRLLIPASANKVEISALQSTDNAGLAMARAVAVVRILRADPRLSTALSVRSMRRIKLRSPRGSSSITSNLDLALPKMASNACLDVGSMDFTVRRDVMDFAAFFRKQVFPIAVPLSFVFPPGVAVSA